MAHASASALRHSQKLNTPRFSAFLVIVPAAIVVSGLLFSFPHLQAGGAGLSILGLKKPTPIAKYTCAAASNAATFQELFQNGAPANSDQLLGETTARLLGESNPGVDNVSRRTDLANRKTALGQLATVAPEKALGAMLSPNIASEYQKWSTNCIEQWSTVTGKISVYAADPAKGITPKGPSEQYILQTSTGKQLALAPAYQLYAPFRSGDTVTVAGFLLDDRVIFDGRSSVTTDAGGLGSGYTVTQEKANQEAITGPQETLVLMANFANTPQPLLNQNTVSQNIFGEMNTYYQENSYGKISVVGQVQNWRTVPLSQSCDFNAMLNAAIPVFDADVDFTQYERIIVISPFGPVCPWGGISSVGKIAVTSADGVSYASASFVVSSSASTYLIAHEFGHGLGLEHANFYNCPDVPFQTTGCTEVEYGDLASVMGGSSFRGYFNALEKEYFDWFSPSNVLTVTQSGTYTLDHLEVASNTQKVLKIQRGVDDYLYVEFRQPIGSDASIGGAMNAFDGALLHIGAFGSTGSPKKNQSFLLDGAHGAGWGSVSNAALTPGQTFIDPLTKTAITTIAKGDGTLDVQVNLGKHDFTPPQVAITAPAPGTTVNGTFTVTVDAQDASGIEKVVLKSGALFVRGDIATDTEAPFSFTVDSTIFPAGTATLLAFAYDNAGTPYGLANNAGSSGFFTVNVVGGDVTPPTASMTAPLDNTAVRNLVTVSAQADDNGFISQLKLFVDGVQKFFQFGDSSSISGVLDLTQGTHTAYAVAIDQAGLTTQSATSTFVVDNTAPTVNLIDPAQGATVSASIALTANATDNDAVQKVTFVRDSGTVIGEDTTAPYSITWDTSLVSSGAHVIGAIAYDRAGNSTSSETHSVNVTPTLTYKCGDADGNGMVTISDAVYLIRYIFQGGTAPSPLVAADADGNGMVSISDAVFLIQYIFGGGSAPRCVSTPPSVKLAPDPTEGQTLQSFKAAHPEIFSQ